MDEKWKNLKDKLRDERTKARGSTHEQAHIKVGILCLVESWMKELEEEYGEF